jgi:hypothetical protein
MSKTVFVCYVRNCKAYKNEIQEQSNEKYVFYISWIMKITKKNDTDNCNQHNR